MSVTLEHIAAHYIELEGEYRTKKNLLDTKIAKAQSRLEKLEKAMKNLKYPYWVENLLRPVVNVIAAQLPEWISDNERLTPMGLGSRVSVFFIKKGLPEDADKWHDDNSIYIVFLPGDLNKGQLLYETGELNDRFRQGTIGEVNGFNRKTKLLESIAEAITHLKKQINN